MIKSRSDEIPVPGRGLGSLKIKHCLYENWYYKLHVINGRPLQTLISSFTSVRKKGNLSYHQHYPFLQ